MPGKHRRPKSNPIARGFIVAGAGGAALALPLMGATGAHAAEKAAPQSASVAHTAQSLSASAKSPRLYTVVAGDYLSKIARDHKVRGGWHKLYKDNRKAIGADPSLIHPGLRLTLGAKAGAAHSATPATTSSKPPKPAEPSEEPSEPSTVTEPTAPATETPAPSSDSGFTLPIDGGQPSTPYHASGSSWSSGYHTGVDFSASTGTVVKAVGAGTVVTAGWGGSYGNQVVIQHSDGHYSQYGHMSSLSVSAGQTVSEGQQIGLSGATGNVTGPHLHFEIRTGPEYGSDIDPLEFLRQHGVSI
ncbi:peptidoglycan DD-metalloendopeptidase family protein [Streptomyces sp. NPDC058405]|uniref:M23 family metallopeptidase n=1 Tax=unclassified Streptomyces TaxID=2593676 RepID=UPI00365A3F20